MKKEKILREGVLKLPIYKTEDFTPKIKEKGAVKLDLNENFWVEEKFIKNLLASASKKLDLRFYPPPRGMLAVQAISNFYRIDEEAVIVGNGSDEILDLIAKTFVKSKAKVLTVEPTFPLYEFFVELYGGSKVQVFLEPNFELNMEKILEWNGKAPLLILCSPNNPTGNQFPKEDVKALLEGFKGLIIVDEAHAEFAK